MRTMDWRYLFASAFARRIAFVVVAAMLAWVGIGKAHAQQPYQAAWYTCTRATCTQPQAQAQCQKAVTDWLAYWTYEGNVPTAQCSAVNPNGVVDTVSLIAKRYGYETAGFWTDWQWAAPVNNCPAGQWPDPTSTTGGCLSPESCLARNEGIFQGERSSANESYCVGGCQFGFSGPRIKTALNGGPALWSGQMRYFGAQCGTPTAAVPDVPTPPPVKPQECKPAGAGQTFCQKADGQQCHTASTGTQICWKPGETGTKGTGDTQQERNAGATPKPPVAPTNGDTLIQKTPPVTTTTTLSDATGNTTRTITTTTTNYTTTNGTTAPNPSGEPADGAGTPEGEGGGDKGTASGGVTCGAAPTCANDPIGCAQLVQAWRARCDLEAARNDLGAQIDGANPLMGTEQTVIADVFGTEGADLSSSLDIGGFGFGSTCPAPPEIFGVSLNLDGFCDVLTLLGLLVAAIGILHAFYIVQGA